MNLGSLTLLGNVSIALLVSVGLFQDSIGETAD